MIVCVFVLEGMYQNPEIGGGLVSPNDIINGVICDLYFGSIGYLSSLHELRFVLALFFVLQGLNSRIHLF